MNAYMSHFAVYLFAMVGVICFALFVVQKSITKAYCKKSSSFLKVEDSITIAPKKSLYVIKAGTKKLLIASDEGRTTFLTELDTNNFSAEVKEPVLSKVAEEKIQHLQQTSDKIKTPVMRELLTRLQ